MRRRLRCTEVWQQILAYACLAPEEISGRVKDRARIFASPGEQFGPGGETWLRFNFATPRPILEEALGRLEDAFQDLRMDRMGK